jgi:hypothetical protein
MWCAHHWPEDYDRCVRIGERHVCRRCLVLYPAAAVVTVAGLAWGAGAAWVPWVMLLAPLPTVVEWCAEHLGLARHRPARLAGLTLVASPALGLGFARYLRHPADPWFWGTALGWSAVCLLAALAGRRSARPGDPPQVEGIGQEPVVGHDANGDAGAAGVVEAERGLVAKVPVTVVTDR